MIKNGDKVRILDKGNSLLKVNDIGVVCDYDVDNTFRVEVEGRSDYSNWFTEIDVELITNKQD